MEKSNISPKINANIIEGEKFERKISSNLGELLYDILQKYSDNIIQIDAETGKRLQARCILEQAKILVTFLNEKGVRYGDTIAIMSGNRLEFCIITVSAFFIGATLAPINPGYTPGELDNVMGFSKPKMIFASNEAIPSVKKCMKNHNYVKSVIILGERKENEDFENFGDIISEKYKMSKTEILVIPHYDPKETTAMILCSSGTTGIPKGVEITHDNITACIEILGKLITRQNVEESDDKFDTIVGVAPFFHSFGFFTMFFHLLRGKKMIVLEKFKLHFFLNAIVKYKIRSLVVPPPLLVSLLKDEIVQQYDLSSIEEIYIGAAAIGKEIEKQLRKRYNIKHAGQSYGMTETTWVVLSSSFGKTKVGSVGRVCPGMKAKIIDQNGHSLTAYKPGELCLKGPLIMKCYRGDIASTKHCIDENKWLHTGDIAYYDEDKYFFIIGRIKELIKCKGFQVSPTELENLLFTHPAIFDAAVVGVPHEYAGELPAAFVVKKPGFHLLSEDVQNFVNERVSPPKRLRGGVFFLKEIPRNANGKVLRKILTENTRKLNLLNKL